jgi:hypothetical protein
MNQSVWGAEASIAARVVVAEATSVISAHICL